MQSLYHRYACSQEEEGVGSKRYILLTAHLEFQNTLQKHQQLKLDVLLPFWLFSTCQGPSFPHSTCCHLWVCVKELPAVERGELSFSKASKCVIAYLKLFQDVKNRYQACGICLEVAFLRSIGPSLFTAPPPLGRGLW